MFRIFHMKKYILIVALICFIAVISAVYGVDGDVSISGLNVTTDVNNAFSASHDENKTLVIIYDQDSCVYCEMFKENVLGNVNVQKHLNDGYVVLLVDINKNPDMAGKYNVFGTPTVQFLNPDGKEIKKVEGYVGADEFLKTLKEI